MTATEPEDSGIDPAIHAAMARENAMLRAGVDLDSDQGKILADAWSNKEPDVDAIKRQWEILKPQPAVEPESPVPASPPLLEGEMTQAADRQEIAAGGRLEPQGDELDPMETSIAEGQKVLSPGEGSRQRAGTAIDAMATALHIRAEAAAKGDTRVLVPERHNQQNG